MLLCVLNVQITAQRAIGQVVFSRIVMAVPGMGMYILIIRFL